MDPFVGEIRMFGGNFAPNGWQICDGTLLSISEYQTLYSLLGVTWGGNGVSNFGVPDLRGRIPVGQGQGTGLSPRVLGPGSGTETVPLATANLPVHNHPLAASTANATAIVPGPTLGFGTANYTPPNTYTPTFYIPYAAANPVYTLDADTITSSGSGSPHGNVMPSTVVNFIIATNGVYPSRS